MRQEEKNNKKYKTISKYIYPNGEGILINTKDDNYKLFFSYNLLSSKDKDLDTESFSNTNLGENWEILEIYKKRKNSIIKVINTLKLI